MAVIIPVNSSRWYREHMVLLLGLQLAGRKTSPSICRRQQLKVQRLLRGTHLCTVGERFSAGWITLPNSSRTCLRGAASYKGKQKQKKTKQKTQNPPSFVDFSMINILKKNGFSLWALCNSTLFYMHLLTHGPAVFY